MEYKLVLKCVDCCKVILEVILTEARFIHLMDVINTPNDHPSVQYVGDHVLTSYDSLCSDCMVLTGG